MIEKCTMTSKGFIILIFTMIILITDSTSHSAPDIQFNKPQPPSILKIIQAEKNNAVIQNISELINGIDQTYADLYANLQKGNKLVIFFDPAHGLLPNGQWQGGEATRRSSCTNLPEEYYSILISRKLYALLSKNSFIDVQSTDDYMSVLKGESDVYKNIPFTTTVDMAHRAGAFIIISEHLNNISVLYKADGTVNLPGIHVTRNGYGWKILRYVKDTYEGFLTLYNKLDASGFSQAYALKLKKTLVEKGLKPNDWSFGAVGDSRFCYFIDFPVSIIYESGFISNPEEEKKLRDPEYIAKIVDAQYSALLGTINEMFGVDISGSTVKKSGDPSSERIELLKLARLAVYYVKSGDSGSGIRVIREIEKKYAQSRYVDQIAYFTTVKNSLAKSNRYYATAKNLKKRKKYSAARRYLYLARRALKRAPIFAALHEQYYKELKGSPDISSASLKTDEELVPRNKSNFSSAVVKAPMTRSIILPIEQSQSIEKAIELALAPDGETLKKLVKSFKNAKIISRNKIAVYSAKKKRRLFRWGKTVRTVNFGTGIYIVKLDKHCTVISARYANSVPLNPHQHQNQQYLKNSFFANDTKERSL
ncbi:MAG: hypothetical protein A2176_10945 [Spirochaetes bacterium RBG_13_51_14]|nr:MAG: hypothetical protein A2176_10945 [Spirochaetes bacterium RBG_13_51_14]